jgi:hypothetical protein
MPEQKTFLYKFPVVDTDIIIQAVSKYVNFGCTLIDANRIINNIQQSYADQTNPVSGVGRCVRIKELEDGKK